MEHALFDRAEWMFEGAPSPAGFSGSALISIDLTFLGRSIRGAWNEHARLVLLHAVSGSVRVRLRVMRLARAELHRRWPGLVVGPVETSARFALRGERLFIDVDVEARRVEARVGAR